MTRLTQSEYESAHRIFNHADRINGGYYGQVTLDRILNLVSQNRWIVIPRRGLLTIDEVKSAPLPNIYISFDGTITDNNGRANCYIGINYHNGGAMLDIRDRLKRRTRANTLINTFKLFDDTWEIGFWHKISTDSHNSTPHYDPIISFVPSSVTREDLINGLAQSDQCLLRRGDIYPKTGTEVLGSISILSISKNVTIDDFDENIVTLSDVFRLL